MSGLSPPLVAACGLGVGAACGFAMRRARLCSFGALESAMMGGDWRRMRVFGLALAVAMVCTQTLIGLGVFTPAETAYLPPRLAILSILAGAGMFGLGMSLVGTCAFGTLVRLGGGDLRSLVVTLVFGAFAYAALRGALSPLRLVAESFAAATPGGGPSGLFELAGGGAARAALTGGAALALTVPVWRDKRLRTMPRLLAAGVTLGLGVAAGWLVTASADDFEIGRRVQSLTYVAPTARALYAGLANATAWADFGVGTVIGAPLGAFLAARLNDEARWEAFDDAYEMRRHLLGAALMGVGGVLAGGCTIGQGLSAGALGAFSWPLALIGMAAGARLGIALLVEGSLRELVAGLWGRWRGRNNDDAF
jgi:hypothetical protein